MNTHIEEISDEVAERLKLAQDESNPSNKGSQATQNAPAPAPAPVPAATATGAMFPELSPGRAMTEKKTVDEVVAELKKSPFFMTELEENDDTEALKALAYEGTPLENASDFKERGNECFKERRWADAKEFYTKGVLILAAEERKRKQASELKSTGAAAAAAAAPSTGGEGKGEGEEKEDDDDDEIRNQRAVLESLYVNRAACHLELKNYRSCWLDGAAALRLNDRNLKAYYRAARAFLAVGRLAEADDACARGLALDGSNAALRAVARDVVGRSEEAAARRRRDEERRARESRREALLRAALRARGIRTRATARPPELEDARVRLVPDPDDARSALAFPAVLLYPDALQSDFVKAFGEADCLADHLAYVLPPPWDGGGSYADAAAVECFVETVGKKEDGAPGLLKVGKKVPLLQILASGTVEVVDDLVTFYILPKAKAAAWAQEFKMKRVAEKGGG
ncbi:TPR-like protein [Biscogniauxia mediterranea]|nr:TPR-like protein [Biscogniauxia mediterranea]